MQNQSELKQMIEHVEVRISRLEEKHDAKIIQIRATIDKVYLLLKNHHQSETTLVAQKEIVDPAMSTKHDFPLTDVNSVVKFNKDVENCQNYMNFLVCNRNDNIIHKIPNFFTF